MQDLRFIGVHEDGGHLFLADDQGNRYTVPLDEPLRAAARRDRPRMGQLQMEIGEVRPKDVQSMIRAGMTAEEVAERSGWPVEKVHRYEGPILAERDHVAGLAQQVRLRARGGGAGAPTLGARVTERLRSREIDTTSARWDSRRSEQGAWTVLLLFNAGGRRREASWDFDLMARTVTAVDDEARWLSEDEDSQSPGPIPAPHLAGHASPSDVYDVEAEGGIGSPARRRDGDTVDLMAAMRERSAQRGRRRRPRATEVPGIEHAPEEALPLEPLARDPRTLAPPPAAHTHPEDDPDVRKPGSRPAPSRASGSRTPKPAGRSRSPKVPVDPEDAVAVDDDADANLGDLGADLRADLDGLGNDLDGLRHDLADDDDLDDIDDELVEEPDVFDDVEARVEPARPAARAVPRPSTTRRSGRPSVPSWDDIMFGRRGE
ncbi:DNA-binding protein [Intrasporangium oryzae NRRL B-24470]|uniref:DNA-binding protein n=1 Tax=Intrasporangium oryzae NRRL B-24470 TaxID=1386089 RepID=W9G758_9MICO|nr:septation protein SepH [Intrasporangium oryzae]EWT01870.1 DNA-binding protein [Intrasporangium oryzae NRRL B-24470]